MKAYKQINYSFENRMVFGYAASMIFICFMILLSPILAQERDTLSDNEPKIHYDVKKQYDKDGNIIGYDSTYSWYWSNKGSKFQDFDSIFDNLNQYFPHLIDPGDWSWNQHFQTMPPFWFWYPDENEGYDDGDTSINEFWDDLRIPHLSHWNFPFGDSLGISFFNFDDLNKFFDQKGKPNRFPDSQKSVKELLEQQEDFIKKMDQFQKEQQQLIEKYFSIPDKTHPDIDQQRFSSPGNSNTDRKSGII